MFLIYFGIINFISYKFTHIQAFFIKSYSIIHRKIIAIFINHYPIAITNNLDNIF